MNMVVFWITLSLPEIDNESFTLASIDTVHDFVDFQHRGLFACGGSTQY